VGLSLAGSALAGVPGASAVSRLRAVMNSSAPSTASDEVWDRSESDIHSILRSQAPARAHNGAVAHATAHPHVDPYAECEEHAGDDSYDGHCRQGRVDDQQISAAEDEQRDARRDESPGQRSGDIAAVDDHVDH